MSGLTKALESGVEFFCEIFQQHKAFQILEKTANKENTRFNLILANFVLFFHVYFDMSLFFF
jgi:hypothetical protein